MAKEILSGTSAVCKLEEGCRKLTDVVAGTIGPKGRNVVLERKYSSPLITNDGVTIAKEITLSDPIENIGASIIKEASIKTNDVAGDGTTTACVLANSIVSNGVKNYIAGANPIILRHGISKACDCVVKSLDKLSSPISSNDDIYKVAKVSAQDDNIGRLIAEAFRLVGKTGVITVEDSNTLDVSLRVIDGLEYDKGYLSPYMCNDMEKMEVSFPDADIYVTESKINNIKDILPVLEYATNSGRPMLIICDDIENDPLATIVVNKMRGTINVAVTKAPAYADRRSAYLEDIAIMSGATLISSRFANESTPFSPEMLGRASIKVTKDSTILTHGAGDKNKIANRYAMIQSQIETCDNEFDKTNLRERLAKLSGGIAQILVGATTEIEQKELKLRIEDAISATKSAISEGIVAGGGIALIETIKDCNTLIDTLTGDEKTGAEIVRDSLMSPLLKICENAGVSGEVVLNKILSNDSKNYGYNAYTGEFGDMIEMGIIDPKMVERCAIQNACSVASTLLTTASVVVENDGTTQSTNKS